MTQLLFLASPEFELSFSHSEKTASLSFPPLNDNLHKAFQCHPNYRLDPQV